MVGRLPRCKALTKIGLNCRGSLVALLRGLREELHHHRRELGGHRLYTIARRDRLSRKVAMDQFDGIGRGEGQPTSQQFVESDPQSVEVAAGVDRPVHPAGLLRRHVGERASYHFGRLRQAVFAGQTRGDAQSR